MDKMFYTLQEVCSILSKSEDEVREMVTSGQLQEFRDKDELVFKVEQINLMAGVDEDSGDVVIDLGGTNTGTGSGLGLTGGDTGSALGLTGGQSGAGLGDSGSLGLTGGDSAMGLSASSDAAGLSAFGTGEDMPAEDDAGATRVGDGMEDDLTLESVGSGSGLLDLTRESDDTTLGAELLEDAFNSDDDNFEIPANASGLFEAASPDETEVSGAAAVTDGGAVAARAMPGAPMAVEAYDGSGSGLGIGAAIGAMIALVILLIILIVELSGTTSALAMTISESIWIWTGGLFGVAILAVLAGMFIGRASE